MITWLIGKNDDIDIIWTKANYVFTNSLENIKNINLFEEIKYKYIFDKKDSIFFKQTRINFQYDILIKGLNKNDFNILDSNDRIINIDKLSNYEKIKLFLEINEISLDLNIEKYVKNNIKNLTDFTILLKLLELNIEKKDWPIFFDQSKENWYLKLKNNTLLSDSIISNENVIPMMQYMINANHSSKPILLYLQTKIKEGYQIWDFYKFWESII